MRYEEPGRICQWQVEKLYFLARLHDRWDHMLYRWLTPSAYEHMRNAFVLRLWRHPRWMDTRICWIDESRAEAKLRAVLKDVKAGDVLWILPTQSDK
jgi:hypothetical protein